MGCVTQDVRNDSNNVIHCIRVNEHCRHHTARIVIRQGNTAKLVGQAGGGQEGGGKRVGHNLTGLTTGIDSFPDHDQTGTSRLGEPSVVPLVRLHQAKVRRIFRSHAIAWHLSLYRNRCPFSAQRPLDVLLVPGGIPYLHSSQDDRELIRYGIARLAGRANECGPVLRPRAKRPQFRPGGVADTRPLKHPGSERDQPGIVSQPRLQANRNSHPLLRAHVSCSSYPVPIFDGVCHPRCNPAFQVLNGVAVCQERGHHGLDIVRETIRALRRQTTHAGGALPVSPAPLKRTCVTLPHQRKYHLERLYANSRELFGGSDLRSVGPDELSEARRRVGSASCELDGGPLWSISIDNLGGWNDHVDAVGHIKGRRTNNRCVHDSSMTIA